MDYVIETDFQGPGFVAVPNHVLDVPGLSPEAIGLLVWFARQPRGFIARAAAVQDRFAMGKDRWQRIAAELRTVGAIRLVRMRGPGGRLAGGHYVIRWPDAAPKPLALVVPEVGVNHKPENPAHGPQAGKTGSWKTRLAQPENPAERSRKTRLLNKEEDLDLRALSSKVRDDLRAGRATYLGGVYREPASSEWKAARAALLSQDAENEGAW